MISDFVSGWSLEFPLVPDFDSGILSIACGLSLCFCGVERFACVKLSNRGNSQLKLAMLSGIGDSPRLRVFSACLPELFSTYPPGLSGASLIKSRTPFFISRQFMDDCFCTPLIFDQK